ncbi:hypothetical protein DYB35_011308 [Aphanomyces astaci]|uniref:Ammonium transporter AmtB-like domain-containing protein n=1 Tax=Aphanomyces astaci TaxID=112090 RepID=A0A418DSQ1_APHAT|nr:hypothetical protein DYB35_011308 [Aphanomyces astaci]
MHFCSISFELPFSAKATVGIGGWMDMAPPILIEFLDDGVDFSAILSQLVASRQRSTIATTTTLGALIWHTSFALGLTMHVGYLFRRVLLHRQRPPISPRRLLTTYIPTSERPEDVHATVKIATSIHLANLVPGSVLFAAYATIYYGMHLEISHTISIASTLSYWSYSLTIVGVLAAAFASTHEVVASIAALLGTAVIYPPVLWCSWLDEGWFNPRASNSVFGVGAVDFGGSGVLHVVAGTMVLVLSLALPSSTTPSTTPVKPLPHYSSYASASTMTLWLGTCSLLINRMVLVVPANYHASTTIACLVNPTLAFAGGGLVGYSIDFFVQNNHHALKSRSSPDAVHTCCAAAVVAIGSLGPLAEPYVACLVGASAAVIVLVASRLPWLQTLDIPLQQTIAIHLIGGMWGVFMGGVGGAPRNQDDIYGHGRHIHSFGLLYEHRGSGSAGVLQWATNLLYLGCVMLWTASVTLVLVCSLRRYGLESDRPHVAFDTDMYAGEDGYVALLDDDDHTSVAVRSPGHRRRSSDILRRVSSPISPMPPGSISPSLEELQGRRRNSPFQWV